MAMASSDRTDRLLLACAVRVLDRLNTTLVKVARAVVLKLSLVLSGAVG